MPVAVNDAGEAVRLDPATNTWVSTKVAENPNTGERMALDGNGWVTVAPATKKPSFEEPVREFFRQNLAAKKPAEAPADGKPQTPDVSTIDNGQPKPAKGFLENLEAGYQMSTAGLAARGKMPSLSTAVDADRFERLANAVGMTVGDIPAMVAGALGGATAGATVGSAVPVLGTAAGGLVGGGAGAMALPAALRQSMVDAYSKGEVKSFADYWDRVASIFMEFGKGAVIGGTTAASGGATNAAMAGSGPLMRVTASTAAEITTMVTMGKTLEGQVPEPKDFIDAAVLIAGMKGATYTAGKLQSIYAKTGVTPVEVLDHASRDPVFKQEVLSKDETIPSAYRGLEEPPPVLAPEKIQRGNVGLSAKEWTNLADEARLDEGAKLVKAFGEDGAKEFKRLYQASNNVNNPARADAAGKEFDAKFGNLTPEQERLAYGVGEMSYSAEDLGTIARAARSISEDTPTPDLMRSATRSMLDVTPEELAAAIRGEDVPSRAMEAAVRLQKSVEELRRRGVSESDMQKFASEAMAKRGYSPADAKEVLSDYFDQKQPAAKAIAAPMAVKAPKAATVSSDVLGKPVETKAEVPPMPEPKPAAALPETPARGDAEKAVLDRIAQAEPAKKATSFNDVYTAFVDDLHPIKQFRDLLTGKEPMLAKDDPYIAARLSRGSYGKADHFLEFGTFDFKSLETTGKGLKQIIEPIKDDIEGFKAYAVAARSVELDKRGIESGVPIAEARAVAESGKGKYGQAFKELQDYQNGLAKYLRDSGILNKDTYDLMVEANKSYVPFYRLMDENGGRGGTGVGLRVRNPIKGIKGSERQILDPLESIVKNTYLYVTLAERNRALTNMAALAEKSPLGAELMQKVPTPMRPIEVSQPEVAKFMAEHGIEGNADTFTIFRPNRSALANDEVAVFRDGKREVYQVAPEVAAAVNKLDRGTLGLVTRILATPARMLRGGVTLTPEFMARNLARDTITAAILPKYQGIPIYDTLRGLGDVVSKDGTFQDWLKAGGANSAIVSIDRDYISKNVFNLSKETGLLDKTWNVVRTPMESLRMMSELAENATRMGVYRRAVKNSNDPNAKMAAAFESREGTLDFQRIGAQMRAANAITAFMNVGIQGIDRTVRAFQDRPLQTTARVAAFITAPSVLLWYVNHDDPRYAEIPQWQKDLFWIVMGEDSVYRIPKPFELGVLFGSLPERALDAFFKENPRAFKDFGQTIMEGVVPNYIPTFLQPFLEHWANKSFFTGNPIVPFDAEAQLPEYQYAAYTSEAAKKLGQFVAMVPGLNRSSFASPAIIENYIRAWSGNTGATAIQFADLLMVQSGAVDDPVKPIPTLADIPVIRAFVVRHPSAQAQSIQDFLDRHQENAQVLTTIKKQAQAGNFEAVQKLVTNPDYEHNMMRMDGIKDALTQQNRFIRMVYANKDIKPEEKRQIIDQIYNGMIETARLGNAMADQFDKSLSPSR